ncbi:basic salivary proline-rich protein 2-like isoform X2 [Engraulis encrasicolus]|uniref:basic salivary proline-rich protein 2-like isoform X2 n=1 Tax=Engraulis encrasicolus TaxID=184585 RepID=UPI002FD731A1
MRVGAYAASSSYQGGSGYIEAKIGGSESLLLIDSGATLSVIPKQIWLDITKGGSELTGHHGEVSAANGGLMGILGKWQTICQFDSLALITEFLVADVPSQDILLGFDFLNKHGVMVDFGKNECRIMGKMFPLIVPAEMDKPRPVTVPEDTVIPPRSEVIIAGKVDNLLGPGREASNHSDADTRGATGSRPEGTQPHASAATPEGIRPEGTQPHASAATPEGIRPEGTQPHASAATPEGIRPEGDQPQTSVARPEGAGPEGTQPPTPAATPGGVRPSVDELQTSAAMPGGVRPREAHPQTPAAMRGATGIRSEVTRQQTPEVLGAGAGVPPVTHLAGENGVPGHCGATPKSRRPSWPAPAREHRGGQEPLRARPMQAETMSHSARAGEAQQGASLPRDSCPGRLRRPPVWSMDYEM